MSNKHKQHKGCSPQGPYKQFLKDVHETLTIVYGPNTKVKELSQDLQHTMYHHKFVIQDPKAFNEHITTAEVKLVNSSFRRYFKDKTFEYSEGALSIYQIHLLGCFTKIRFLEYKRKHGPDYEEYVELKDNMEKTNDMFFQLFILAYVRIVTQISSPDHKYYCIQIRPAAIFKDNPKMELVVELYGFKPQKTVLQIEGIKRPAFRLATVNAKSTIKWLTIGQTVLDSHYTGTKTELEVYIQSHALKRFRERLDILDSNASNYLFWENTVDIKQLLSYKNLLLLPVLLYDVKVGYWVCKIVDDNFLLSTFLFVTHNCTPEGDKLRKISGLKKEDMEYWKIDRLSTFVGMNEEKYPALNQLFCQAGISGFKELRNKKFDIDSLQEANLEGLMRYMSKNSMATV